jgi:hypothetical protein
MNISPKIRHVAWATALFLSICFAGPSFATNSSFVWGLATDIPVTGDFDGDGKTERAIYRPSTGMYALSN